MDIRIQENPTDRAIRFLKAVVEAEDPWAALPRVLDGMRQECRGAGGDEVRFAGMLAYWLAQFTSIPVLDGAVE